MVAHTSNPSTQMKQEDQKFKIILSYVVLLRLHKKQRKLTRLKNKESHLIWCTEDVSIILLEAP